MSKTSTTMSVAEAVQEAMDGRTVTVRCSAHEDGSPSLSVKPGTTQPVMFHCHAGCDPVDIIESAGLNWADVCAPIETSTYTAKVWTPDGDASKVYPYTDHEGLILYEVIRVDKPGGKKRIFQRRPDSTAPHGYAWNLDDTPRVLYKLPDVLAAVRDGMTVHVTEGEKCADALQVVLPEGEVSTCNSGGAGNWNEALTPVLAGASVVIHADADEPGRAHARAVREALVSVGCTVRILEAPAGVLPGGKHITDVADHLQAGRGLDALLETTPEALAERSKTGIDILELVKRPRGRVEFVIDNTLAKGERVVLVGLEGRGKSELLRQIAVMCAAGLHPWTGLPMSRRSKVLFIDPENHPDQVQDRWGHLIGLAARHEHPVEAGYLTLMEEWETDRMVDRPEGKAWLLERVHAYKPDLVIMGPLTYMTSKDLKDDEPVRRLRQAVNEARAVCNSAFIMEHHAPLKGATDKVRVVRPYGSSMLLRFPDYGYGMTPTDDERVFEWSETRGPRVRGRRWPSALRHGSGGLEWPWVDHTIV